MTKNPVKYRQLVDGVSSYTVIDRKTELPLGFVRKGDDGMWESRKRSHNGEYILVGYSHTRNDAAWDLALSWKLHGVWVLRFREGEWRTECVRERGRAGDLLVLLA